MKQPIGRVLAYARVSIARGQALTRITENYKPHEGETDVSIKRQIADFEEWAKERNVTIHEIFTDEGISGQEVPYYQRPGWMRLQKAVQPGDSVVVWRLDRIDRGPGGAASAVNWLHRHGATVYPLQEYRGDGMSPESPKDMLFAAIAAAFSCYDNQMRKAAQKEGLQFARRQGRRTNKYAGYGRTFVKKGKRKNGAPQYWEVWDPVECDQIRELYRRVEIDGEPVLHVAIDFDERQGGEGRPYHGRWLIQTPATQRIGSPGNPQRAYNILRWYKYLLSKGLDLGCSELPLERESRKSASPEAMAKTWGIDLAEAAQILADDPPKKPKKPKKEKKIPKCFQISASSASSDF